MNEVLEIILMITAIPLFIALVVLVWIAVLILLKDLRGDKR